MSAYLIWVSVSAGLAFLLWGILLKKQRFEWKAALWALIPAALAAIVFAKAGYVLLMQADILFRGGEWGLFLELQPKRMCFTCGAAGVVLAVFGTAKCLRLDTRKAMDCFAAPGALLVAGLRWAEKELGRLGTGSYVEGEGILTRFPFAVRDSFQDPYTAVFFWEMLIALIIGAAALMKKEERPGRRFRNTVFDLCLCQILLENLRTQDLRWGFVHTEQILCAVTLLALTVRACVKSGRRKGQFRPLAVFLLLIAAVAAVEYTRQKGGAVMPDELAWLAMLMTNAGFWFMALLLAGIRFNDRRLMKASAAEQPYSSGQESSKGV